MTRRFAEVVVTVDDGEVVGLPAPGTPHARALVGVRRCCDQAVLVFVAGDREETHSIARGRGVTFPRGRGGEVVRLLTPSRKAGSNPSPPLQPVPAT
jgi:hypothetical protein